MAGKSQGREYPPMQADSPADLSEIEIGREVIVKSKKKINAQLE